MTELKIISKEDLKSKGQPRTEVVPFPELGCDMAMRIRGWTMGEVRDISNAANTRLSDGKTKYDARQDALLSVVTCVVEPKLSVEDTDWISSLSDAVIDRILDTAHRLSGRTQTAYDDLKSSLRVNPLLRQLYVFAARSGRLPSELDDISEEEFRTMLAAAEVEAEEAEQQAKAATTTTN